MGEARRDGFSPLPAPSILAGVIANMRIYFRPTSLFNTLVMLILFVGGLGLIARALGPHAGKSVE
jgi:hypothetical protein